MNWRSRNGQKSKHTSLIKNKKQLPSNSVAGIKYLHCRRPAAGILFLLNHTEALKLLLRSILNEVQATYSTGRF